MNLNKLGEFNHTNMTQPMQAQGAFNHAQGAIAGGSGVRNGLPCLQEMGDIAPALENLLLLQAEYARREPGVSRAMRDVAYNAVAVEIERYCRMRMRT